MSVFLKTILLFYLAVPLIYSNLTFLLIKSRFFCRPIHARASKFQSFFRPWVDMTTHCRFIAVLSVDTSRDLVTLTFDLLNLNSCHVWRVTWPTLPPSLRTLRLFVYELRVITVPIDYRWKCVPGHCACAESRDLWIGDQKRLHFGNPRSRFATSVALRWK